MSELSGGVGLQAEGTESRKCWEEVGGGPAVCPSGLSSLQASWHVLSGLKHVASAHAHHFCLCDVSAHPGPVCQGTHLSPPAWPHVHVCLGSYALLSEHTGHVVLGEEGIWNWDLRACGEGHEGGFEAVWGGPGAWTSVPGL